MNRLIAIAPHVTRLAATPPMVFAWFAALLFGILLAYTGYPLPVAAGIPALVVVAGITLGEALLRSRRVRYELGIPTCAVTGCDRHGWGRPARCFRHIAPAEGEG